MKKTIHSITINNKKYTYELKPASKNTTKVTCKAANIDQEFLNEDVAELLNDLPNLILSEKEYKDAQNEVIRFRVSSKDKQLIEKNAAKHGYTSVSGFLRDLSLKGA